MLNRVFEGRVSTLYHLRYVAGLSGSLTLCKIWKKGRSLTDFLSNYCGKIFIFQLITIFLNLIIYLSLRVINRIRAKAVCLTLSELDINYGEGYFICKYKIFSGHIVLDQTYFCWHNLRVVLFIPPLRPPPPNENCSQIIWTSDLGW